ncbi:carbohydrate ABC transporter permease [Leifsonia bigeumensis]|uniref:Carbohydrate ABC transporter permease n=1 Tax=Leifsonella bigeumensis TaxID=433643 RepID=A0ABP7F432_9MICO
MRPVKSKLSLVALSIVAIVVSFLAMAPLLWAIVSAFRPAGDIFRYMNPLTWLTVLPIPATLDNFVVVWESSFPLALANSVLVTTVTVALGLAISVPAAFALSALNFRGRGLLFAIVLVSFLIPFDSIAIPLSTMFRTLKLSDSYLGIILPAIGNGLAIFQLRQFFLNIPVELKEAARLDGLGWFGLMSRIYIPLAKPAILGAGLLIFIFQWQSYLWPLLIAPDPQFILAPIAIANYAEQYNVAYGAVFLAGVVTAIVPLLVLLATQRLFVQSIATTGSKG